MFSKNSSRKLPQQKMTPTQWGRQMTNWIVVPIADLLANWGISPNLLTVAGLLANMAAALLLARGELVWAGVVLLILGPLDGLDGALARRLNQSSKTGAFLDSNFDRLSEIAVYLGLVWHYQEQNYQAGVILAYLTITGSLMVSYARARAEALGAECQIGIMTRMERFLVLLIGLFSGYMTLALAAMAALTYVTVLQRIWHTRKELKER